MRETDNRQALSSAALRRVDDFSMSITPPYAGVITLWIHLDGDEPISFVLRAENDELMKIKAWMEDVVRDESAEVALSGGRRLAYRVTDVPESAIAMLFWKGWRECAGEVDYIEIEPYLFDLSDIEGLSQWGDAFRKMRIPLPEVAEDEDDGVPGRELTQERKDWQIQGYHLAQQVRRRLPLNVPLLYELTYEIAYDTPLWKKDVGHIIFNPGLLEP